MEISRRFFDIAGPLTPEQFFTGNYPAVEVAEKLTEFEAILNRAESVRVIRQEFNRIFNRKI